MWLVYPHLDGVEKGGMTLRAIVGTIRLVRPLEPFDLSTLREIDAVAFPNEDQYSEQFYAHIPTNKAFAAFVETSEEGGVIAWVCWTRPLCRTAFARCPFTQTHNGGVLALRWLLIFCGRTTFR